MLTVNTLSGCFQLLLAAQGGADLFADDEDNYQMGVTPEAAAEKKLAGKLLTPSVRVRSAHLMRCVPQADQTPILWSEVCGRREETEGRGSKSEGRRGGFESAWRSYEGCRRQASC